MAAPNERAFIPPTSNINPRPQPATLGGSNHTSHYTHMSPNPVGMSNMNINAIHGSGQRREPKPTAEDNVQSRFELFLLGDGEKKVTEEPDTRKFLCHSDIMTTFNAVIDQGFDVQLVALDNIQHTDAQALPRHPFILHLHIQQGRSHSRQHDTLTTSTIASCHIRGLQGATSSCRVSAYLHSSFALINCRLHNPTCQPIHPSHSNGRISHSSCGIDAIL